MSSNINSQGNLKDASTVVKPWVCDICGFSCSENGSLKLHISQKHKGQYECRICRKHFRRKICLTKHNRIHEKPYSCGICQRRFSEFYHLKAHCRQHERQMPHPCMFCERSFSCLSQLKIHLRIHTGEKPFVCDICQRAFRSRQGFDYHMLTHSHEDRYSCDVCPKKFCSKANAELHKKRMHGINPKHSLVTDTGIKCPLPLEMNESSQNTLNMTPQQKMAQWRNKLPAGQKPKSNRVIVCDICGFSCSEYGSLKLHISQKHKRQYECRICHKHFPRKRFLTKHNCFHEKRYTCGICQRSFRELYGLRKHSCQQLSHPCMFCIKSYSCMSQLKIHLRVHTGEEPFVCDFCQRAFRWRKNFDYHMLSHSYEDRYSSDSKPSLETVTGIKCPLPLEINESPQDTLNMTPQQKMAQWRNKSPAIQKPKFNRIVPKEPRIVNRRPAAAHEKVIPSQKLNLAIAPKPTISPFTTVPLAPVVMLVSCPLIQTQQV